MQHVHPLMAPKRSQIVNTRATPLRRTSRVAANSRGSNAIHSSDGSGGHNSAGDHNSDNDNESGRGGGGRKGGEEEVIVGGKNEIEFQFHDSKLRQKFPRIFYSNQRAKKFETLKKLGDGGFSICFLFRMPDNSVAAGKIFSRGKTCARKRLERFEREVDLMKSLDHPNIVHYIDSASGVYKDKELTDFGPKDRIQFVQPPVMFLEYCAGGSLSSLLKSRLDKRRFPHYRYGQLMEDEALWVMECAARALAYIHEKRIIHRDIKLGNLLLQSSFIGNIAQSRVGVVVCDFGLAVYLPENEPSIKGRAGTPSYMPRELVRGHGATFASDIWSLGVTIFHCLTGRAPFEHEDTSGIYRRIRESAYRWKSSEKQRISPQTRNLVEQMMAADPRKRPTAAQLKGRGAPLLKPL
jgi:serine/threonine protein kinase